MRDLYINLKGLIDVSPIFVTLYNAVNIMQFIVPVMVGVLVGLQFNLNPMQSVIVGLVVFLGSGAYKVTEHGVQMVGIGAHLFNILGTSNSAGFGLVGPLAAINSGTSILGVVVAFVVIPFVIDLFCKKVLHLYDENIFKYI